MGGCTWASSGQQQFSRGQRWTRTRQTRSCAVAEHLPRRDCNSRAPLLISAALFAALGTTGLAVRAGSPPVPVLVEVPPWNRRVTVGFRTRAVTAPITRRCGTQTDALAVDDLFSDPTPSIFAEGPVGSVPESLTAPKEARRVNLSKLLAGPDGKQIQQCAKQCVTTCVRGGAGAWILHSVLLSGLSTDLRPIGALPMEVRATLLTTQDMACKPSVACVLRRARSGLSCDRLCAGAPGLGPLSQRGEVVVFKDAFRSRSYCLRECSEVCALQAQARREAPR
jgi:hypothetical protein